jgi:subtilisin family serine protease
MTFALAVSLSVSAKTTLDARSQRYVNSYKQLLENPGAKLAIDVDKLPFKYNPDSRTSPIATVFVTLADGKTADDVAAEGLTVVSKAGKMVIASAPIEDIAALGETDVATKISFVKNDLKPLNKQARAMIGMDAIHNGTDGLGQAYKGKGVLCGIFDQGFDAHHPNFYNNGETRIARLWHFYSTNGSCKEYTSETIDDYTYDLSSTSHGTHTTGIMAGCNNQVSSTNATFAVYNPLTGEMTQYNALPPKKGNNPYYGMAPESTIIAGMGNFNKENLYKGLSNMVEYAKAEGKPLVINMSLGANYGSHDEYEPAVAYLDEIAKDAIICVSSGNEGDENFTIVKKFDASDSQINTFVDISSSMTSGTLYIYSADSTPYEAKIFIADKDTGEKLYEYKLSNSDVVLASSSFTQKNYVYSDMFDRAFGSSSYLYCLFDNNEDTSNRYCHEITYNLLNNSTTNASAQYVFGISVKGTPGQRVDVVNVGDGTLATHNIEGYDVATPDLSINYLACGKNTIAVGAHTSSDLIYTLNNTYVDYRKYSTYTPGKIATFTSYGELYDGRKLPHICAPGVNVISSVSSYDSSVNETASGKVTKDNRTYYWTAMSGTSMACPVVAGTIATWLEAYPQLTTQQAIELMQETAVYDDLVTESAKGNGVQAGAGRLDALAGLKKLLGLDGVANISAKPEDVIVSSNDNVYTAFVAGASNVNAQIYNLSGQLVANASAAGDEVNVDASSLSKGVYVLKVNNYSQRILVK